jgi:hypothetical protein
MPLLKTKIFRPGIPRDFVPRQRLLDLLDSDPDGSLTLVAALNGILNSLFGLHLPVLSVERLGGTN